jgi:hypothetical protein
MRHAQILGARDPLMWRLVPTLVREMGQAYPELTRAETLIAETLKLEERRFRKTLERGLAILDDESRSLARGDRLKGETAFTLYDTYGFPLDLTQDALKPRGIAVDTEGFNTAMERQREKARASWAGSGDAATEAVWFRLRENLGATEFLGYETETAEGVVAALGEGRQGGGCLAGGRDRRGDRQPDAVLRRVGRPDRRHGNHARRRPALHRHRHPEESGRPVRPFRRGGGGHAQGRCRARARRRPCPPQRDPPESFGDSHPA